MNTCMIRVSKIHIHDDIIDILYVMHENVLVYKHTDIQTHENAHTYEHTSGTREWQSTGSATVLKPLTGSEEGDVKLKRPYIRMPCCITSDDMLALLLLPWRACRATNNSTIFVSSSSRVIGGNEQGMALKMKSSNSCLILV